MSLASQSLALPFTDPSDARLSALVRWLATHALRHRLDLDTLAPASADASFRRYFRIAAGNASLIAMDAPPEREDCASFVRVARLLADAGVHAPRVVEQDLDAGFLLLTDLGDKTYLSQLDPANPAAAAPLMSDAIDALIQWQRASRPGVLPPYDAALLRRELDLFPDWYVARHLGHTLTAPECATLSHAFDQIIAANLAGASTYVHRDYMPRNLMLCSHEDGGNPGVLDFQDAVFGPISYDVASLFKDAFISWDEEVVLDWTVRYWERAKKAALPVPADFGDFFRDVEWMGLQRHLKVLGIFARIRYRDGKPHYLTDAPRFLAYVHATLSRYRALGPLKKLLDALEGTVVQIGYTF